VSNVSVLENLGTYEPKVIDKHCFFVKYEIPEEQANNDWSNDYISRIRESLAVINIPYTFVVIAVIFGNIAFRRRVDMYAYESITSTFPSSQVIPT